MSGRRGPVPMVVVHGPASGRVLAALVDSGYVPVAVLGAAVVWVTDQRQPQTSVACVHRPR